MDLYNFVSARSAGRFRSYLPSTGVDAGRRLTMRVRTVAIAGGLALLAGVAVAQNAGPPPQDAPRPQPAPGQVPPPPPPPPSPAERSGEMRPGGDMRGRMGPDWGRGGHGPGGFMHRPPHSKGAMLKVDRDGGFFLKCGEEDGAKACMEAAAPLIDKIVQSRQGAAR
jgi:hypothetical protein